MDVAVFIIIDELNKAKWERKEFLDYVLDDFVLWAEYFVFGVLQ